MGLVATKPVFGGLRKRCRLISAFVIRLLESIISKLASSDISIFQLVSVAEETGLSLALSETSKTGFFAVRPIFTSSNKVSVIDSKPLNVKCMSKVMLAGGTINMIKLTTCKERPKTFAVFT